MMAGVAVTPMSRSRRATLTKRQQSRGATSQMSGFVTEAFTWRHREQSRDRESDEETTLEDAEYPIRHPNDPPAVGRKLYTQTCAQLNVVPISAVLRNIDQEQLSLPNRNCGPLGAKALSAPLMVNTFIVELDLSGNDIQDNGLLHIVAILEENRQIKRLNLSKNNFTHRSVPLLCKHFTSNNTLHTLDLSDNNFRDANGKCFENMIENNKTLKCLRLSNNDLGIETGIHIGNALGLNVSLNDLDLSWNHIRLKGAHAIAKGLKDNVTIHRIDLSWNGFDLQDSESLRSLLCDNNCLLEINLSCNRLNDKAIALISLGLEQNDSLQTLKLSGNPFSNSGAYAILKAVEQNETLENLIMTDITVKEDFMTLLKEIKANKSQPFHVTCKVYTTRKVSSTLHTNKKVTSYMRRAVKFLLRIEKPLHELFPPVTEDSEDACAMKEEFIDKLQEVGVTLNTTQLNTLSTHLENEDRGLLDLSPLFKLEKDLMAEEEKENMKTKSDETQNDADDINDSANNTGSHLEEKEKIRNKEGKDDNNNNQSDIILNDNDKDENVNTEEISQDKPLLIKGETYDV